MPIHTDDGSSRALIPFPPLPAVFLLPFVALWGRAADGQLLFAILAAIDVGIAWWALGRLPIRRWVRVATVLFLAFGTVLWYAAHIGTTWFQAHVVAIGLAFLAVGLAARGDPDAAIDEDDLAWADEAPPDPVIGRRAALLERLGLAGLGLDRRQFLAGVLFGLACTARLTVLFAAPFFLLVGTGGTWLRRGFSAGLGAAIPIGGLLLFNLLGTGSPFNPAYDHLYQLEAAFYVPLNYHAEWAIEDPRYVPQNLAIMLFGTPVIAPEVVPAALGNGSPLCIEPGATRGLFDEDCPIALPRDTGMSILLTSPAFLLAIPALRRYGRSRLVTGAALAILLIALVNLMHFSQGWVQFGYRFSNDFVPWALLLVALGMERARTWVGIAVAAALVAVSIAVNHWGVTMGSALGW